ncbi:MAG: preprotein translocase subunit SecG, partial [Bacteroidota bacterium]
GGGLASNFSSSNQVMGVRKTADFLEKATWTLASTLLFLSLIATAAIPNKQVEEEKSVIEEQIQNYDPNALPNFPTTVPDQNQIPGQTEDNEEED